MVRLQLRIELLVLVVASIIQLVTEFEFVDTKDIIMKTIKVPGTKIRYRETPMGWESSCGDGRWLFTFRGEQEILQMHPTATVTPA